LEPSVLHVTREKLKKKSALPNTLWELNAVEKIGGKRTPASRKEGSRKEMLADKDRGEGERTNRRRPVVSALSRRVEGAVWGRINGSR